MGIVSQARALEEGSATKAFTTHHVERWDGEMMSLRAYGLLRVGGANVFLSGFLVDLHY